MSEGPPKKPHEQVEQPAERQRTDTQTIFRQIKSFAGWIEKHPLPGSANREVAALAAAHGNLEYILERDLDPGAAYIAYVHALDAIVSDDTLWGTIEKQDAVETVASIRIYMQKYLKELQEMQIDQFIFTGRKQ